MEAILSKLSKIDSQIQSRVNQLLASGKSSDIIIGIVNGELDQMILGLGLEDLADKYANELLVSGLSTAKGLAGVSNVENLIQSVGQSVEVMAQTYRETILGHFAGNVGQLKTELLNGLLNGVPTAQITKNLQKTFTRLTDGTTHYLNNANINTVISTSYSNVSRIATSQAFTDDKEQRFEYVGGVIPTSSKQCEYLMTNQNPEGYTKAEIDAGIDTPDGMINWMGRQPNYNCIHQWFPVDNISNFAEPNRLLKKVVPKKVVTSKGLVRNLAFTPAKTVKEAEQYLVKNGITEKVNYSNVSIEQANETNRVLSKIHKGEKLKNINFKDVLKDDHFIQGFYDSETKEIMLKRSLKTKMNTGNAKFKTLEFHKNKVKEIEGYLVSEPNNPELLKQLNGAKYRVKNFVGTNETVGETLSDVLAHEYGHKLDYINTGVKTQKHGGMVVDTGTAFEKLWSKNFDSIGNKYFNGSNAKLKEWIRTNISEYATVNRRELFAEAYSLKNKGGTLPQWLDDLVIEVVNNAK